MGEKALATIIAIVAVCVLIGMGLFISFNWFGPILLWAAVIVLIPLLGAFAWFLGNMGYDGPAKIIGGFAGAVTVGAFLTAFVPGIREMGRETANYISRMAQKHGRELAAPLEVPCTNEFSDPRTNESVMFYRTNTAGMMICYEHAGHVLGEPLKPVTRDLWQANLGRMNAQKLADERQAELATAAKQAEEARIAAESAAEERMRAIEEEVRALKEHPPEPSSPVPSPISEPHNSPISVLATPEPIAVRAARETVVVPKGTVITVEVRRAVNLQKALGRVASVSTEGVIVEVDPPAEDILPRQSVVSLSISDISFNERRGYITASVRVEEIIRRDSERIVLSSENDMVQIRTERRFDGYISPTTPLIAFGVREAWVATGSLFRFKLTYPATIPVVARN